MGKVSVQLAQSAFIDSKVRCSERSLELRGWRLAVGSDSEAGWTNQDKKSFDVRENMSRPWTGEEGTARTSQHRGASTSATDSAVDGTKK